MKKCNYFIAAISLVLMLGLVTSCGGNKAEEQKTDKLGKMEVVIPDELKDNPEMVEYIEGMTEVIDQYAVIIDDLIPKMEPFKGKTFEELKLGEQLKFTKIMGEAGLRSTPVLAKWADIEMKRELLDAELTEDELLALETVWQRFEDRMMQIEEKHSEVLGKDPE